MDEGRPLFLVHIHTPKMDHYALRETIESANEEVFLHAQGNWAQKFPGVERPSAKEKVIERYYRAVENEEYVHVVDISPEGNWVMEDVTKPISAR